jgi:hypothetical protein
MSSTPSHACPECGSFHTGECNPTPDPARESELEWRRELDRKILDGITDKVLAYKPNPKTKAEKRRIRRRKREARKLASLTPAMT